MARTVSPMDQKLQHLRAMMDDLSQLQTGQTIRLAEQSVFLDEQVEAQKSALDRTGEIVQQMLGTMQLLERKLNARIKLDEESRLTQIEQLEIALKSSTTNMKDSMQSLEDLSVSTGEEI
ncbi:hypothetical protein ABW20_dc0110345 [Dactylellina cionopaga]|nr:hypothetical protein ABW20_dc0110345 [Dactylellina cionopaga]